MHAWPPAGTRLSLLFYERARTCGSTPNGEFLVFGRWGKLGKEEGGGGETPWRGLVFIFLFRWFYISKAWSVVEGEGVGF